MVLKEVIEANKFLDDFIIILNGQLVMIVVSIIPNFLFRLTL